MPLLFQLVDAVNACDVEAVRLALNEGCLPNDVDEDGRSVLSLACAKGHLQIGKLLVERGANPNEANNPQGLSLLHKAVRTGNFGMANSLLSLGANANVRTKNGQTPLHLVATKAGPFLADLLKDSGADVNSRDGHGDTPLHEAIAHRDLKMAKHLIGLGANPHLHNRKHRTPLDEAELSGFDEGVKYLSSIGSRRSTLNFRFETQCAEPKNSFNR